MLAWWSWGLRCGRREGKGQAVAGLRCGGLISGRIRHPQKWCWGDRLGRGVGLRLGGWRCRGSKEDVIEMRQGWGEERLIGREGSRRIMPFEGSCEVVDGLAQDLIGGGSGHGHLVGKPSHGVGVDNLVGAPLGAGATVVAFKVGASMPAVNANWSPSGALAGFLVHDYVCAKGGNGVSIVIIGTIQTGRCGMLGFETRGSK